MNLTELIDKLKKRKITIGSVNEKLRVVDPDNNLTPDLLSELKARKADFELLLAKTRKLTKSNFRFCTLQNDMVSDLEEKFSSICSLLEQSTVALLAPYVTTKSKSINAPKKRIQSIAADKSVLQ